MTSGGGVVGGHPTPAGRCGSELFFAVSKWVSAENGLLSSSTPTELAVSAKMWAFRHRNTVWSSGRSHSSPAARNELSESMHRS